jgi:hypothetical protein
MVQQQTDRFTTGVTRASDDASFYFDCTHFLLLKM